MCIERLSYAHGSSAWLPVADVKARRRGEAAPGGALQTARCCANASVRPPSGALAADGAAGHQAARAAGRHSGASPGAAPGAAARGSRSSGSTASGRSTCACARARPRRDARQAHCAQTHARSHSVTSSATPLRSECATGHGHAVSGTAAADCSDEAPWRKQAAGALSRPPVQSSQGRQPYAE